MSLNSSFPVAQSRTCLILKKEPDFYGELCDHLIQSVSHPDICLWIGIDDTPSRGPAGTARQYMYSVARALLGENPSHHSSSEARWGRPIRYSVSNQHLWQLTIWWCWTAADGRKMRESKGRAQIHQRWNTLGTGSVERGPTSCWQWWSCHEILDGARTSCSGVSAEAPVHILEVQMANS